MPKPFPYSSIAEGIKAPCWLSSRVRFLPSIASTLSVGTKQMYCLALLSCPSLMWAAELDREAEWEEQDVGSREPRPYLYPLQTLANQAKEEE